MPVPDRPNPPSDRGRVELLDVALDVRAALARLSSRQRMAVDLHYYAGLTVAEAATVMGCRPGTVKSTLSDARARLHELLEGAR